MAIWFLRLSAAICLTMTVGGLGLVGQHWYEASADQAAIAAAQQHVSQLGGSSAIFLEDGKYVIVLHGPEITDAEIERLVVVLLPLTTDSTQPQDVEQMFAFNLAGTNVGNRGVQAISTLRLSWLNLNGTQITDEAFTHLQSQDRLSLLTVAGTQVTRPGIKEIQDSLPVLWIPTTEGRR